MDFLHEGVVCYHGWNEESEGRPCPTCAGYCSNCGRWGMILDWQTGNCLECQEVFDSDYQG
jgi:hypothetical protein